MYEHVFTLAVRIHVQRVVAGQADADGHVLTALGLDLIAIRIHKGDVDADRVLDNLIVRHLRFRHLDRGCLINIRYIQLGAFREDALAGFHEYRDTGTGGCLLRKRRHFLFRLDSLKHRDIVTVFCILRLDRRNK